MNECPILDEIEDSLYEELRRAPWGNIESLIGVVVILLGAVFRRKGPSVSVPQWVYVANAPNGRLGVAAAHAVDVMGSVLPAMQVVADSRLADPALKPVNFPGLGVRSLRHFVDRGVLSDAWRGFRYGLTRRNSPGTGGLQGGYLFLAQFVRYALADRVLSQRGTLITDFDRDSYAAPLVFVARSKGWVTATTVHGSLNPASYCPFRAEHVMVWGRVQAEAARKHGAVVHIVGRADLETRPIDESPIARVVICASGEILTPVEVRRLVSLREDYLKQGIEVHLRRHPRHYLLDEDPSWCHVAVGTTTEVAQAPLFEDLRPGDFVVGITSTAMIEALAWGCRVACFADATRSLPADIQALRERVGGHEDRDEEALTSLRRDVVSASGRESDEMLRAAIRKLAGLKL